MKKTFAAILLISGLWISLIAFLYIAQNGVEPGLSIENEIEGSVVRSDKRISVNSEVFIYDDRVIARVDNALEAVRDVAERVQTIRTFFGESVQTHVLILPSASAMDPMTQMESTEEVKAIREVNALIQNAITFDVAGILEPYKEKRLFYFTDEWWTSIAAHYASIPLIKELGYDPQALSTFNLNDELDIKGTYRLLQPNMPSESLRFYLWQHFNPIIDVTLSRPGEGDFSYQTLLYAKSRRGFDSLVEGYYRYATIPAKGDGAVLVIGDNNAKFMVPWLVPYYGNIYLSSASFDNRSAIEIRELIETAQIKDVVFISSYEHLMDAGDTQAIYNWIKQEGE